jgi:glutamine amidotransferase
MSGLIGIVDYGMGNICSLHNALQHLGYDSVLVDTPEVLASCSHVIIPGVGSYAQAMTNLRERQLDTAIQQHVALRKPLLGICLGMQILSDSGEEGGYTTGLGFIKGHVKQLQIDPLPVPHVGWNNLTFDGSHPLVQGVKHHVDFYFVHSFYLHAEQRLQVLAFADYGCVIPAIVVADSVVGIQFHPEKSQDNGLQLLDNFCLWEPTC